MPAEYKIDGEPLKQVDEAKDLGVIVDKTFSFKTYCLNVVKKASFLSYTVLRLFKFCIWKINILCSKSIYDPFWIIT